MTPPREERIPDIHKIIAILRREIRNMDIPIVTEISHRSRDPFHILVSTILSLRTKDEVTRQAATRLLGKAQSPEELLLLPEEEIARLIFPVGFYKTKARTLKQICRDLIDKIRGKGPERSGRAPEAQGRRAQDRQPGPNFRVSQARHLRGHSRAQGQQQTRIRQDENSGTDRDRPEREAAQRVLDRIQRPSGNLGSEHLQTHLAVLLSMRCVALLQTGGGGPKQMNATHYC